MSGVYIFMVFLDVYELFGSMENSYLQKFNS